MFNLHSNYKGWSSPRFETTSSLSVSQKDEEMREQLLQRLVSKRMFTSHQQIEELHPQHLPLRELPPGSTASLYLMYVAYMRISNEEPASRSTFYSVCRQWSQCLRFRRECEHAMCATCQSLRARIHNTTDFWIFPTSIFLCVNMLYRSCWHHICSPLGSLPLRITASLSFADPRTLKNMQIFAKNCSATTHRSGAIEVCIGQQGNDQQQWRMFWP